MFAVGELAVGGYSRAACRPLAYASSYPGTSEYSTSNLASSLLQGRKEKTLNSSFPVIKMSDLEISSRFLIFVSTPVNFNLDVKGDDVKHIIVP